MALSPYEQNILDFTKVIENQPELLSDEDRVSLEQLMANIPDEVEEISNAIALWIEEHSIIFDALLELHPTESGERGLGGSTIRLSAKDAKDLIENTVRQSISNSPSQTFQTSNDQYPSNPGTT